MDVDEKRRNYESFLNKVFAILVDAPDVDDCVKREVRRSVGSGELLRYLRHPDTDNNIDFMINDCCDDNLEMGFVAKLSDQLWNGDLIEFNFSDYDFAAAVDLMVSERVKTIEDFLFAVNQMSKIALSQIDMGNEIEPLLSFLTDINIALGKYKNALKYYAYIDDQYNRLINLKLLTNYHIEGFDIASLVRPSEFGLTEYEFHGLLSTCRSYINYLLSCMELHGFDINQILKDAAMGNELKSILDLMPKTITFLKEHDIHLNLYGINAHYESLYNIIELLYKDMKLIRLQTRDVSNIVKDWEDELKIYFRLKNVFPKENMVHNYSASWLWKFKLAIYFPTLNLAFDYRGPQLMNPQNYSGGLVGQREYFRLYDRTIEKSTKEYGIYVVRIDQDTPFAEIVDCVNKALMR